MERKQVLGRVANVALACALSAVAAVYIGVHAGDDAGLLGLFGNGTAVIHIAGVQFGSSRTAVLVLSTRCPHCASGAAFYRRLREVRQRHSSSLNIIAVFPNEPHEVARFMDSAGLDVPAYSEVSLDALGVAATPTILLVDRAGKVVKRWVGEIPAETEGPVERAILDSL
jgi:hypothetical protein